MQATGMINDHIVTCFRRKQIIAGYHRAKAKHQVQRVKREVS
jgi:hypothetical protein